MVSQVSSQNQKLVASFISFLKKQSFSEEHSEGIEISIQCLIEAFGLTDSNLSSSNVVDLLSLISSTSAPASINKSEAERQKALGNEFVSAKKPAEAVECYSKAIELDPTNAIYFSNRAAAYAMMEEHFKALEDSKKSCELNPSYSKAYNRLGKAHLALGEPEEALAAFERAHELEPNDVNIKNSLEQARRAVAGNENDENDSFSSMNQSNTSTPSLGGFDFGSILNNPQFINMAQQMMSSGAMNDLMKDPKAQDMMKNMMGNPDLLKKFTGGK